MRSIADDHGPRRGSLNLRVMSAQDILGFQSDIPYSKLPTLTSRTVRLASTISRTNMVRSRECISPRSSESVEQRDIAAPAFARGDGVVGTVGIDAGPDPPPCVTVFRPGAETSSLPHR